MKLLVAILLLLIFFTVVLLLGFIAGVVAATQMKEDKPINENGQSGGKRK